jgi:hypothetical protein
LIITRFNKGKIFRFSDIFYRVDEVERIRQKFDNDGGTFPVGANAYKIVDLTPEKGRFVHVDKIGINGYVQIQLYYPERNPRGAVSGAQRIDYRVACHQNPYKFIFFVPTQVDSFLDIFNPETIAILSEIFFYGWIYDITEMGKTRPIDPVTREPLPFIDITSYTPHRG